MKHTEKEQAPPRACETSRSCGPIRSLFSLKNDPAKAKALKITVIYALVGCSWILFSDKIAGALFVQHSNYELFSIIKGMLYVLLTALLIYSLTYPALRRALDAQATIQQANEELATRQSLLKALIDSIPDLIVYKDTKGRFLGCNKAFEAYVGKSEGEVVGKMVDDLFDAELAQMHHALDSEVVDSNLAHLSERIVPLPDGEIYACETLKAPYYDAEGQIIGLISISRNITERKKREDEIRYLNHHDIMTGLYNRAYFQEALEQLDTPEYLPLSVIIGDVNGLKLINDAMGHAAGDRLLIEIANILRRCCRKDDVIARMGGDEYSILLPRTDAHTAWSVIEQINAACAKYGLLKDKQVVYTNIALGYATKTQIDEPLDRIMRSAEEFMYRRKLLEYKSVHNSILSAIKSTMAEKTPSAAAHEDRVASLARQFGHAVGLSEEDVMQLELVSSLHDIGTISIDEKILNKPGPLSGEEWCTMRKHPEIGFRIANASPEFKHIAEFILCHHERWDGTGYPQRLAGEQIPLLSRLVSILDAYDAMTHETPYHAPRSHEEAIAEIVRNAGTQFDPTLAGIFVQMLQSN